jgi:hypothetical protein
MIAVVFRRPLEVIRSTYVRKVFKAALAPELKRLGFKTARDGPSGWAREVPPIREMFWVQFSPYGFFSDIGGEFIVEFIFNDSVRRTAIRDRLWRLLDDSGRVEVVRLNNQAIKSLPGPLNIFGKASADMREMHRRQFEPIKEMPSADSDVWFRYATYADVDAWAQFLARRFGPVVAAIEERLRAMPEGAAFLFGSQRSRDA